MERWPHDDGAVKVVLAALPAFGHVYPLVPLAIALERTGAEVVFATGKEFASRLPARTVPGAEGSWAFSDATSEIERRVERFGGAGPLEGLGQTLFVELCAPHVVDVMTAVLERERPDLVVFEQTNVGAAGDVFIGYPDSEGNISGQPVTTPAPAPTPYDPAPVQPPAQPLPDWTRNGSFVVYRKLRQDVAAFKSAVDSTASAVGLRPEQLAAKTVGRWPSGAPMERVPGCPAHIDPSVTDPSIEAPAVLGEKNVNSFDYSKDVDGNLVPRGSHIRKMNPRADVLPDGDAANKHRLIRRGITYGPEFQASEPAYGGTVPDTQDRGLLFVNYQSSIARFLEFVQSRWANREDFQKPGDGKDPILSQDTPDGIFNIPPKGQVTFARWVVTVGGGYFFTPSLPALSKLAGG